MTKFTIIAELQKIVDAMTDCDKDFNMNKMMLKTDMFNMLSNEFRNKVYKEMSRIRRKFNKLDKKLNAKIKQLNELV